MRAFESEKLRFAIIVYQIRYGPVFPSFSKTDVETLSQTCSLLTAALGTTVVPLHPGWQKGLVRLVEQDVGAFYTRASASGSRRS